MSVWLYVLIGTVMLIASMIFCLVIASSKTKNWEAEDREQTEALRKYQEQRQKCVKK